MKNKKEKTADVKTIVISTTKNENDVAYKRQVVEHWVYKDGKKESFTFHEKSKNGKDWNRVSSIKTNDKKSHLHLSKVL